MMTFGCLERGGNMMPSFTWEYNGKIYPKESPPPEIVEKIKRALNAVLAPKSQDVSKSKEP